MDGILRLKNIVVENFRLFFQPGSKDLMLNWTYTVTDKFKYLFYKSSSLHSIVEHFSESNAKAQFVD